LLHDDLHVAVPHNHPTGIAAGEALKVKTTMCDRVRDVRACPGQVLVTGVASVSQEVHVKIGQIDEIYYKQVVGLRLQNIRAGVNVVSRGDFVGGIMFVHRIC